MVFKSRGFFCFLLLNVRPLLGPENDRESSATCLGFHSGTDSLVLAQQVRRRPDEKAPYGVQLIQ